MHVIHKKQTNKGQPKIKCETFKNHPCSLFLIGQQHFDLVLFQNLNTVKAANRINTSKFNTLTPHEIFPAELNCNTLNRRKRFSINIKRILIE